MSKPDFEKIDHDNICHFVGGMAVVSVIAAFNIAQEAYTTGRADERKLSDIFFEGDEE